MQAATTTPATAAATTTTAAAAKTTTTAENLFCPPRGQTLALQMLNVNQSGVNFINVFRALFCTNIVSAAFFYLCTFVCT